ncbi:hypothetical protein MPTK1_7g07210 [Marchantia polymorpha subsp. ruderalis]|uniref:Uncharacterized protein n=2 Tax=Marchantia polymorpha TaxID=3197 RepID=A0AAF6BX05_MARPO|nr:hypothetical protein MARPO_0076s0072 [Marchantia polymorpha]BBN16539.1 hypothetical protein Mp_7g07210 [Marchantia polymorpha subsp. ruderalis]BBN16540.1 hypothetical protein Mp_7g07220 [Marchantia polymorpha subsp. ruderalis]|eukprot:PTQ34838.1 hypothetical protein MARPO_0076s0072 [Marchantia polymorpha]
MMTCMRGYCLSVGEIVVCLSWVQQNARNRVVMHTNVGEKQPMMLQRSSRFVLSDPLQPVYQESDKVAAEVFGSLVVRTGSCSVHLSDSLFSSCNPSRHSGDPLTQLHGFQFRTDANYCRAALTICRDCATGRTSLPSLIAVLSVLCTHCPDVYPTTFARPELRL